MRRISEIIEIRIHVKRPLASGWAGLSPCSGRGNWTILAYLPDQDWPVFLLRQRVPDWTGLSPCSGTGSQTRLACLCSGRGSCLLDRTGLPPLEEGPGLCKSQYCVALSQPFWAYININSYKNHKKKKIHLLQRTL